MMPMIRRILLATLLMSYMIVRAQSPEDYVMVGPYEIVARDGQYRHTKGGSERDMRAAYDLAVAEDEVESVAIINAYAKTLQQTAIEHYLGVNSFPTYKLIDRDGNILDVNADPRDLNALENLLKTMNGTKD